MRVGIIGPFAIQPKGTVQGRILSLAEALQTGGHQVFVVIPPYDNLAESGRKYMIGNIPIHNICMAKASTPFRHLLTAWRLVRETLKLDPDIIHIFKPRGDSGLAAMLLILGRWMRLARIPIVLDTDDWEGHGGFYDYWLTHHLYPRYQLEFVHFQEQWVPKHVDAVTVASRTLQTQMWGLGIPMEKVFHVPNGPRQFGLPSRAIGTRVVKQELGLKDEPVILLYTRFFEFDVESVIKILVRVKQQLEDVRLLVVGRGEFGEEEKLTQLAEEAGLRESIIFAGWIEPEELPAYLELGDVAIYPFNDTLLNRAKCPGKLVELMSLSKAIVADRVGEIAEYIQNGSSGILVDPGDTERFAQDVISVLKDEYLRMKLEQNAKERIWGIFHWDRLVLAVEKAYEKATSKS